MGGPDLGALLGGGGGGPAPAGGGQGAAGQAEDPEFKQLIQTAIDALHQAQKTNEDDTDKALAAECMSKLQGLLGTHQKQRDAALGMTDVHRGVRRALRGGGAAGAGAGGPGY